MTSSARWMMVMACLSTAAGCDFPGRPDPKDKFVRPGDVVDFSKLFAKNCAGCHGKDGESGAAPPLNDPIFLSIASVDDVSKVIANGRPGTEMPAFLIEQGGTLKKDQVEVLAKGLFETWGKKSTPKADWPSYTSTAKGDKTRGAALFEKACAGCHGQDGLGTKEVGPINDPVFLALASETLLRRIIITGRPDLGMPNSAEKKGRPADFTPLTNADVDDLTALLTSWKR